jgi:hypothetical protein
LRDCSVWCTKLANSLALPVVAELSVLLSGSTIRRLITMAISGLGGKVLITGGAWLGVKPFGMPYEGFSNGSSGAEELDACGLRGMLYGSEDVLNVLKIFTKSSSSMYFN